MLRELSKFFHAFLFAMRVQHGTVYLFTVAKCDECGVLAEGVVARRHYDNKALCRRCVTQRIVASAFEGM